MTSQEINIEKIEKTRSDWGWVPSLNFAEGFAYSIVALLSVIMYKRMGISNADIALYTSWLYCGRRWLMCFAQNAIGF